MNIIYRPIVAACSVGAEGAGTAVIAEIEVKAVGAVAAAICNRVPRTSRRVKLTEVGRSKRLTVDEVNVG